jgi:hypothetical protein
MVRFLNGLDGRMMRQGQRTDGIASFDDDCISVSDGRTEG